jgi:hypothetical protein
MSGQTPLWREMLAASEEALRGREFVSLEEADRVVAEAHLRIVESFLCRLHSDLSTLQALSREIIKAVNGDQM